MHPAIDSHSPDHSHNSAGYQMAEQKDQRESIIASVSRQNSASSQLAGKPKANELTNSGDSMEPANRRPAPGDGSAPLPASSSVTSEQPAIGRRQLGPPEAGATYAALLAGPVTQIQPSGLLKSTAVVSDPSDSAVSNETANRGMYSVMSGPLSGKPDGTTPNVQAANTCLPAGQRPNKKPIFNTGVSDTRSWPGCGRPALAVLQPNLRWRN
jgi:hypothetical protein